MKPLMTILIPTYDNATTFIQCYGSLMRFTEFPFKVVIVNNDPMGKEYYDKFVENAGFENLEVLHMDGNKGWMGAINAGMEKVDTEFVCVMNDDLIFHPGSQDFWRKLTIHLGGEVAAIGPSTNFVMGRQAIQDQGTPSCLPVKFLIGFCMVLRTQIFRDVGLLDESLPGGDDLDLSIRLREAGWQLIAEKTAYVHHVGSSTGAVLQPGYWNSMTQSDLTNNVLIRKHGLKAWYDCVNLTPWKFEDAGEELMKSLREEDTWWEETLAGIDKESRGLNVGSGTQQTENAWDLDRAKPGERGAGGRKFDGATPDTSGDAADLPMRADSLDFIAARHLFEHMLDPVATLKEWKRVVKPGGLLFVICPNQDGANTMLVNYTHVHAYNPQSLGNLLESQGWRVEEAKAFAIGSFAIKAVLS